MYERVKHLLLNLMCVEFVNIFAQKGRAIEISKLRLPLHDWNSSKAPQEKFKHSLKPVMHFLKFTTSLTV